MESNPKKLLDEFIPESVGKQFVIPVYQRKYTWTVNKQIEQLIKDLIDLIEDDNKQRQHFLGSIVFLENIVEYKTERSIVDGQQRLITMFLIAHAMKSIAENEFRADEMNNNYLQNVSERLDSKYRQRLYPSVSDGNDYLIIAESRYDEINKDNKSNIVQNFIYLQKELKKLTEEYSFDQVLFALKRFSIVYIKLDERDDAQQIFESINSTGERLTASDLIRNFIMMNKSNDEQTELYNKYWRRIEETFENSRDMEDFVRYYLAAVTGEYSSKSVLYKAFKNYWNNEKKQYTDSELLIKIVNYAKYFEQLYFQVPSGKYKEIVSDFKNIESKMPAPFVLEISDWYYNDGKITEEQYYNIIEVLNNYQIRRAFNGDDTSRVSKAFPSYLKRIKKYVKENGYHNIVDIVIYVIVTKNQSNNMALPTDKSIRTKLANTNAYGMRLSRWLLDKIENKSSYAKLDMKNLSVEHIMPQTITPYWREKAGVSGEEYTDLVNNLGNLTLVTKPDNSAAGNRDFEVKKRIFKDTLHIHMNKELYELEDWTADSIEKRREELIDELISMYPYLRSIGMYDKSDNRKIYLEVNDIKAEGYLNEDDTVMIYAGSEISSNLHKIKTNSESVIKQRKELIENGVIEEKLGKLNFVQDYNTSSISRATEILIGGSRNGWEYWKDSDGIIVKDSLRNKLS